jgi:hypothetical protein
LALQVLVQKPPNHLQAIAVADAFGSLCDIDKAQQRETLPWNFGIDRVIMAPAA